MLLLKERKEVWIGNFRTDSVCNKLEEVSDIFVFIFTQEVGLYLEMDTWNMGQNFSPYIIAVTLHLFLTLEIFQSYIKCYANELQVSLYKNDRTNSKYVRNAHCMPHTL